MFEKLIEFIRINEFENTSWVSSSLNVKEFYFNMKDFFSLGEHVKMVMNIYIIVLIFICFYFFKYFKIIDNQLKFLLILLFFGFIYAILYGIEEDQKVTLLKKKYSLTTGNVEEYFVPKFRGRGSYTTIKYIYQVNNDFFENQYQENYYVDIPDDKPDLSLLYLVIYEKTNPKIVLYF